MNGNAWRVQQQVRNAWDDAIHRLQQISQATTVRPTSSSQIIALDQKVPSDVVKLIIGPVVFNLCERPNQSQARLFIVMQGWLSFQGPNFRAKPFQTRDFGTAVAYFRFKSNQLDHIFGAHYDIDEHDYRHPVFHGQLTPKMDFGSHVQDHFQHDCQIVNRMGNILRTVRIPTAQMDVFSVLIQICADHLIGQSPAPSVTKAFQQMRTACDFFTGAAHRMTFLNTAPATACYRSTHWYN